MIHLEKTKRIQEVHFLTTIFCICVVLIHLTADPVTKLQVGSYQHTFFYIWNKCMTFVVPGFIFLSGIKLGSSYRNKKFNFIDFFKKRFLKIIVPYSIWYLLYYLLFRSLGFIENLNINQHIVSYVMGTMVSPFYFITIIFQFYILFFIFLWLFKSFSNELVLFFTIMFGLGFLEFYDFKYIDRFFLTYIIYFIIGMYAAFNYDKFKTFIFKYKYLIFLLTFFITVNNIYFSYTSRYLKGIFTHYRVKECIFSVCWILLLFLISNIILKYKDTFIDRIFKSIDGASYYIFLSHCFVIYICADVWYKLGYYSIIGKFLFSSIIVFTVVFSLCILYNSILKDFFKNHLSTKEEGGM